ncbi:hypothetical protein ACHAWF_014496 [Thalassiosira exigua]
MALSTTSEAMDGNKAPRRGGLLPTLLAPGVVFVLLAAAATVPRLEAASDSAVFGRASEPKDGIGRKRTRPRRSSVSGRRRRVGPAEGADEEEGYDPYLGLAGADRGRDRRRRQRALQGGVDPTEEGSMSMAAAGDDACPFCPGGLVDPTLELPTGDGTTCARAQAIAATLVGGSAVCETVRLAQDFCCPAPGAAVDEATPEPTLEPTPDPTPEPTPEPSPAPEPVPVTTVAALEPAEATVPVPVPATDLESEIADRPPAAPAVDTGAKPASSASDAWSTGPGIVPAFAKSHKAPKTDIKAKTPKPPKAGKIAKSAKSKSAKVSKSSKGAKSGSADDGQQNWSGAYPGTYNKFGREQSMGLTRVDLSGAGARRGAWFGPTASLIAVCWLWGRQ